MAIIVSEAASTLTYAAGVVTGAGFTGLTPSALIGEKVLVVGATNPGNNGVFTVTANNATTVSWANADGVTADTADLDVFDYDAPADGTTLFTVLGTGFGAEIDADEDIKLVLASDQDQVFNAGSVTRVSATKLTFAVPWSVEPGVYKVKVHDTQGDVVSSYVVSVTAAAAATISSVAPTTAANDDSDVVTITGTNFKIGVAVDLVLDSDTEVTEAVANVTRVSDTSITFTVPATVAAEDYRVRITDSSGYIISTDVVTVTAA
jgi:hypothetical protein